MAKDGSVVIVGVGPGLGAALGMTFAKAGFAVALAARKPKKLDAIVAKIEAAGGRATAHACDVTDEVQVIALFDAAEKNHGPVDVAIHNASNFTRAPIADLAASDYEQAWRIIAFGGFLVGREAARRMVPMGASPIGASPIGVSHGQRSILFTGATASVRGGAAFAAFAGGKFALRALAQSMARELGPKGIHVAHFILDGMIGENAEGRELEPAAIAEAYLDVHRQDKSAWSHELDLRPWSEKF
jgi:NAD(P)-dependent dehydrogenase (short-subunit alcohol dehydrogenase family)